MVQSCSFYCLNVNLNLVHECIIVVILATKKLKISVLVEGKNFTFVLTTFSRPNINMQTGKPYSLSELSFIRKHKTSTGTRHIFKLSQGWHTTTNGDITQTTRVWTFDRTNWWLSASRRVTRPRSSPDEINSVTIVISGAIRSKCIDTINAYTFPSCPAKVFNGVQPGWLQTFAVLS